MATVNLKTGNNKSHEMIADISVDEVVVIKGRDQIFNSVSCNSSQGSKCRDFSFEPRLYKKRWFIVFLFAFYSASNAFQWIHLNIIGDKILKFYEESLPKSTHAKDVILDMLSLVYMIAYIIFFLPASWILDKKGLHFTGVIGTLLNALGAWIKCSAVNPNRFALIMAGQCICAVAQAFILGVPARLAAVWFGTNEVSTATAIGVFGNQVGCALGFFLPPLIVDNSMDSSETISPVISNVSLSNVTDDRWMDFVSHRLNVLLFGGATVSSFLLILVFLFFSEKPPIPPSLAQVAVNEGCANVEGRDYFDSIMRILKNHSFVLLLITYGLNTGSYYVIGTLLNPIVLHYFLPNHINAGQVGLTLVVSGVIGSILSGVWLDRTKLFKATTVFIYLMSCLGMLAFTLILMTRSAILVFLCTFLLGFFMTGYLPIGFEYAAELTYPEPEGTSSGLINASAQIFGIALTFGIRSMTLNLNNEMLAGNLTITLLLLVGVIGTIFIRGDLKRQKAQKEISGLQLISRSISHEKEVPIVSC